MYQIITFAQILDSYFTDSETVACVIWMRNYRFHALLGLG